MRSHVNQSTFIQYLFVAPSDEDFDLDLGAPLDTDNDREAMSEAWQRQFQATPLLFFHETYHYWQGLRLPFLYRFAVLSHRVIMDAYKQMAALGQPLTEWDCTLPELYRLAVPARVYWWDDNELGNFAVGGIEGPPAPDATAWWQVTPQGLLETAASLAEFQVMNDRENRQDPAAFRRWCKRHAAYLDAYEIVAKVMGEQLALMATVPIINGAFETSDPVRGLTAILRTISGARASGQLDQYLAHPEPRQWVNLVNLALDETSFESDDEDANLLSGTFRRIDLSNWLDATRNGEPLEHPFLTRKAKEWRSRAQTDPAYQWLLGQPAWVDGDILREAMFSLGPELSFLKFKEPSRHRPIATGTTTMSTAMRRQLLTIYSVVLRASEVGFDSDNRLCHHSACPLFEANYCSTYPGIPRDFRDCQFHEIHEENVRALEELDVSSD